MNPTWKQRRARVAKLNTAHSPATDLLSFYGRVLECQEAVFEDAHRWLQESEVERATHVDGPVVDVSRFAGGVRLHSFRRFVSDVGAEATPVLATLAGRLADSTATLDRMLEQFVRHEALDPHSSDIECDPLALEFFPRAFMQPVAEAAVTRARGHEPTISEEQGLGLPSPSIPARCPWCGWPPQLAVLVDEVEVRGRRALVCSLCGGLWTFPRATCPGCGETNADQLPHHLSDSWSHVRVEECRSCGTYLKAVDLRTAGLAVPVVDEIASVELDLWAVEQGLEKLQRNLLGL